MSSIETLSPTPVWSIFKQICDIPHPSKHELKLRDHIRCLCDEKGLKTVIDPTGNLIVSKPATEGMQDRQCVVIQGHVDMVPQKNADSTHDFVNDPITTYIDGEWLKAKGTTLGSDNGIGVAAGLAVMLSDDITHGPLELLCTIEEETSMRGAFGLESGYLEADILLNLDTEDEGELYVGCAGGADIISTLQLQQQATPDSHIAYEIQVKGLLGGHSGLDIEHGRANANQMVNRFLLSYAKKLDIRVANFNGGTLRNAIPRESFTLVTFDQACEAAFKQAIEEFSQLMLAEYGKTEINLTIDIQTAALPNMVLTQELQNKLQLAIASCISAPLRMSDQFEGVVETSNNLAIVKSYEDRIEIICLTRSLINSARDFTCQLIAGTFEMIGAKTEISGAYPGWKPNPDSAILQTMSKGYKALFGKTPAIKVIH